jgi:hypothetical protein
MKEIEDFAEQLGETGRIIAERKQKELDKKRQGFLKLIEDKDDWKIRVSLSVPDILVISRVLCRSLSLNDVLQKQSYAIFSCKEEKNLVTDVLHKLLLSFRMSSSHREDMVTHPNYNDKKWHGNALDVVSNIGESFDISYKFVDAQRLEQDHIYESIGPDQYRKNARKVVEDMLRKQKEKEVK